MSTVKDVTQSTVADNSPLPVNNGDPTHLSQRKTFTFPQKQLLNPCFDQSGEFLMSGDISKRFQPIENYCARII